MTDILSYKTIEKSSFAEFKDRGSKFIAYAYPLKQVSDVKQHLQALKKDHAKADHFCFAYRIGTDGNTFRSGDDGEPAGSAGKPILGQIDSKELTDVLVIVVRYFGGSLLGVPGLINAYKTATALALQLTPIIEKPVLESYQLQFTYDSMNDVMVVLKQFSCEVKKQEIQLFCSMEIGIPKSRLNEVLFKMKELHAVEVLQTTSAKK